MPRAPKATTSADSTAHLGFEAKLWLAADKLRNNMDAAEYKHVVLSGLEKSIAVADWKSQITETLPPEFQGSLPTVAEIEAELAGKTFTKEPDEE